MAPKRNPSAINFKIECPISSATFAVYFNEVTSRTLDAMDSNRSLPDKQDSVRFLLDRVRHKKISRVAPYFWNNSIFISSSIMEFVSTVYCLICESCLSTPGRFQSNFFLFQPIFIRPIDYHNPPVLVILKLYRQWLVDSIDSSFWSKMGLEHTFCWEEIWTICYGTNDKKRIWHNSL